MSWMRAVPPARTLLAGGATIVAVAIYDKQRVPVRLDEGPRALGPIVPIGWGSNKLDDCAALAETYSAAIDARGDLWMWGTGFDPTGVIGRSLRGKNLRAVAAGPGKLYVTSCDGRLYGVSASRLQQGSILDRPSRSWWSRLFGTDPGVDYVELQAELRRGERWTDVSVGRHHLLAVTSLGRSFSLPLSPAANSHRQLGTRQVLDADPQDAGNVRYATTLTEIPSLSSIAIAQVAASDRTSFARTPGGRVLGWGANDLGQVGLGASAAVDTVPTPVEVVLGKLYPGGTSVVCTNIAAGGATTFFTVERTLPGQADVFIDLLACGSGITGSLGNGLWSSAASSPVRVKTVSGLQEYSERAKKFMPLPIHSISVSSAPSSHVFAVLDTVSEADVDGVQRGLYGKDVMVWGGNADYQLGNGKRSSLAVPQHLPPLVQRDDVVAAKEASLSSGTLHNSTADAFDFEGRLIKRNVKVEEVVVAGYNASVLYNRIV